MIFCVLVKWRLKPQRVENEREAIAEYSQKVTLGFGRQRQNTADWEREAMIWCRVLLVPCVICFFQEHLGAVLRFCFGFGLQTCHNVLHHSLRLCAHGMIFLTHSHEIDRSSRAKPILWNWSFSTLLSLEKTKFLIYLFIKNFINLTISGHINIKRD